MYFKFLLCTTVGHATKSGGSGRSHQQTSKSKGSSSTSAGDGPTRTSQRSIKRPRTYDEDNSEFESPPSASKSHSKKSKSNPKGSKSGAGSKPVGSTVPTVSDATITSAPVVVKTFYYIIVEDIFSTMTTHTIIIIIPLVHVQSCTHGATI